MADDKSPRGELFSRLYVERGAPTQNSQFFRNRLAGYLEAGYFSDYGDISKYLQQEAGLIVRTTYVEKSYSVYYNLGVPHIRRQKRGRVLSGEHCEKRTWPIRLMIFVACTISLTKSMKGTAFQSCAEWSLRGTAACELLLNRHTLI